jgi:hypothetical protein
LQNGVFSRDPAFKLENDEVAVPINRIEIRFRLALALLKDWQKRRALKQHVKQVGSKQVLDVPLRTLESSCVQERKGFQRPKALG